MYNRVMKKDKLKLKLKKFGYEDNTISKLIDGTRRPILLKAIKLQQDFKIPCTAWADIKSYINNSTPKKDNITRVQADANGNTKVI